MNPSVDVVSTQQVRLPPTVPSKATSWPWATKASPLPNKFQQTASGEMVLGVSFEVFRQVDNPLGQQRNLYFGGAGVCSVAPKLLNSFVPAPNLLHAAHYFSLLICVSTSYHAGSSL